MTTTAQGTWKLTGKPAGTGQCEHCARSLVHRYEVTSDGGARMIVGRGCLKAVTGWTLTAAQAERELRMIAARARRAANWAAFAAGDPAAAAAILADCADYSARVPAQFGGGAAHEVKLGIEEGRGEAAGRYLADRARITAAVRASFPRLLAGTA
jgi:hypothetical protein